MKKPLFILLLVCNCLYVFGGGPGFSFNQITRKDGLASDDVYDIVQDHRGFYWIGTDNGLQRFDGKRWISPVSGNRTIPAKPVYQVVLHGESHLFLKVGETYGIFNTSNFSFQRVSVENFPSGNGRHYLWKDSKGQLFMVFSGRGILWYDEKRGLFTDKNLPLSYPAEFKPESIFEDRSTGHYWIGGETGLVVFDAKSLSTYTNDYNPLNLPLLGNKIFHEVTAVFIDTNRNHWIVYGKQRQSFASFSVSENRYLDEAHRMHEYYRGNFEIDRFFEAPDGALWLYGKSALFNYMPGQQSFFNNKSDLVKNGGARFNTVRSIIQDKEKGIWIATDQGIYQYYTALPEVTTVLFQTDNDDYNISGIVELNNGDLWIASKGKGVFSVDTFRKRKNLEYLFSAIPAKAAYAAKNVFGIHLHQRTGKVWVFCQDGYIIVTDPAKRTARLMRPPIFSGSTITSSAEDASGRLFFGTESGSIVSCDIFLSLTEDAFKKQCTIPGTLNKLMVDNRQRLWASTSDNGLFYFDPSTNEVIDHFNNRRGADRSLSSNRVNAVVQMNDSIYAVATDLLDMLNINNGTVISLSYDNGLPGNTIAGLRKDAQGYLWIATSNGICRYNPTRKTFTSFGEKDGFMKFEQVGASNTLLANGDMLFAGSNMFVTFPPRLLNRQKPPPPVVITDVKVLNAFIPMDSTEKLLSLSAEDNFLSFYFSTMSYLQQEKLTCYYRLKGLQDQWVRADNQLAAIYTVLPSGSYEFQVRCENEDGISSPVTSMALTINPPFWKTWWFLLLVVVAVVFLLYISYRLRIKRILELSELRKRGARDLHDDVGSTLSTISILSTIARGKMVDNPVQAEQYITKISDNSQQMMEAMDDIVWSIKPMNDSMQKIVARMREFVSGALEPYNIGIDFHVDDRVLELKLNMESRRDLFLVFKEAINNIAKYARCTHVAIHISCIRKRVVLKIRDNGIGFDPAIPQDGNGLANMKKRAAMLNGRIKWNSSTGQGTLVVLNIPAKT